MIFQERPTTVQVRLLAPLSRFTADENMTRFEMLWLPFEVILQVFRSAENEIRYGSQEVDAWIIMRHHSEYNRNLLSWSLTSRDWTIAAQSELFNRIILINETKMALLLNQLKSSDQSREHAARTISIRLGQRGHFSKDYEGEGLRESMDALVEYCPRLSEIRCSRMSVRLEDFRRPALPSRENAD